MISQLNGSNPFGAKGSPADGRLGVSFDSYNPAILHMNQNPATPVTDPTVASNNSLICWLNRIHHCLHLSSFPFIPIYLYSLSKTSFISSPTLERNGHNMSYSYSS